MSISDDALDSAVGRIAKLGERAADDRGRSIIKEALKEMLRRPVRYDDARACRAKIKSVISIRGGDNQQQLGQILRALVDQGPGLTVDVPRPFFPPPMRSEKRPWWRRLFCWGQCLCRHYEDEGGCGGQCIRCGKIIGYVTRGQLRRYVDRLRP